MSIKMNCPRCKKTLKVGDELAGKKVRCKDCGRSFSVESIDEPDAEDADEKPRKARRRAKKKGVPPWVWLAAGAGALVLVLAIGLSIFIAVRSRRNAPNVARAPVAGQPAGQPSGPHIAIMEEFQASVNAAADAISLIRDRDSVRNAARQIQKEATKINQLASKLERAGRPSPGDIPRLKQLDAEFTPIGQRFRDETNRVKQGGGLKLDPVDALSLELAGDAFRSAMQRMVMAMQAAQ